LVQPRPAITPFFDDLELAEYVHLVESIEGLDIEEALSMGLIDLDDLMPEVSAKVEGQVLTDEELNNQEFIEF
jgi:hypothetical protein